MHTLTIPAKIPLLVKMVLKEEIICTFATSDLCSIMLRDSAHIQESEAEWRNQEGTSFRCSAL